MTSTENSTTPGSENEPCPFCGSSNVEVRDPHGAFSRLAAIACNDCEIRGPLSATAEHAIAAWNTRAEATRTPEAAQVEMLREALSDARQAIDTLDEDAFGLVIDRNTGSPLYPIRDELLAKIDAALAHSHPSGER